MDARIQIGNQRPVRLKALGTQGSDLSSLFSGITTWESDDPSIVVIARDLTDVTNKAASNGIEGETVVRARATVNGKEWLAEGTVTVFTAPPPPEEVATVQLEFGEEEAIGS